MMLMFGQSFAFHQQPYESQLLHLFCSFTFYGDALQQNQNMTLANVHIAGVSTGTDTGTGTVT